MEAIKKELENLPELNDEELDRLERELEKAERQVQDAKLEQILEDLEREQRERSDLVDAYNAEIERLREEVKNVEQIANALPDGCFKRVQLEP